MTDCSARLSKAARSLFSASREAALKQRQHRAHVVGAPGITRKLLLTAGSNISLSRALHDFPHDEIPAVVTALLRLPGRRKSA